MEEVAGHTKWLLEGRDGNVALLVGRDTATVGAAATNDLVLGGLRPYHAALATESGRLVAEAVAESEPLIVNGRRHLSATLSRGDDLEIGGLHFRVEQRDGGKRPEGDPWLGTIGQLVAAARCDAAGATTEDGSVLLRQATGAIGATLARWDGQGPPVVLSSRGLFHENGDHERVWSFFRAADRVGRSRAATLARVEDLEPPLVCVARVSPDHDLLASALWFESLEQATSVREVAANLVSLVIGALPRGGQSTNLPKSRAMRTSLEFPSHLVRCPSAAMERVYREVAIAAGNELPAMIEGETGVGKEHIAGLVHSNSRRRGQPFVATNCAAIPEELAEAELFGVGVGVATGVRQRDGLFAMADGGSLFLDEVGELPPLIQAKLLRAVETGEIKPLGGRPRRIDVRLISATNRTFDEDTDRGSLRRDLFYRLAYMRILVPPLRDRREDVARLVEAVLSRLPEPKVLSVRALQRLQSYSWPGNVRELTAMVLRASYSAEGPVIGASHLDPLVRAKEPTHGVLRDAVAAAERSVILPALAASGGNQLVAAKLLGVSRNGLALKLRRLGISLPSRSHP